MSQIGSDNLPTGPIRVLLIEDDEVDGLWVKRALAVESGMQREFELEWANRVGLGEEYLQKKTFDVVLSDLKLPDGAGLEIFEMIFRTAPKAPVILLTGNYEEETQAIEALKRGAQDYLFKGRVDSEGLRRALRYAIERKRLHEALALAKVRVEIGQRRLKNVIDVSMDGMLVVDKKRVIRYANPSAKRLLGQTAESFLGELHAFPLQVGQNSELVIGTRKETRRVVEVRTEHTQWQEEGGGEEEVFLTCLHDVTERKRVEEKLEELNQMKSEFVRGVSHEFRAPLATMKEGVSQLLDGLAGPLSSKHRNILSITHSSINRLSRLVEDLLAAAAIEAGKIELQWQQEDLVLVAKEVVASFLPVAEKKGLLLKEAYDPRGVLIDVDKDRLIQILTNLMGNAVKFTEKGFIEVSLRDLGRHVEISVSDTGRGIANQELAKMFSPFEQFGQRLSGGELGTGLGLSISKALAELHGGALRAEGTPGKGSRFTLTIPRRSREELFSILVQTALQRADEQHHPFSLGVITMDTLPHEPTQRQGLQDPTSLHNLEAAIKKTLRGRQDKVFASNDRVFLLLLDAGNKEASDIILRVQSAMGGFFAEVPLKEVPTMGSVVLTYPEGGRKKEELLAFIQREFAELQDVNKTHRGV